MKIRCIIDTGGKVNTPRTIRVSARKSWQKALEGSEPCAAERRYALSLSLSLSRSCHIYSRDADTRVQTCNFPSHRDACTRTCTHTRTRARAAGYAGFRREFNFNSRFLYEFTKSTSPRGKFSGSLKDEQSRRFLPPLFDIPLNLIR